MAAVKFEVVKDASDWEINTRRYGQRIRHAVRDVLMERQGDIEHWMKTNAPWTDRTGNARASLHTVVTQALGGYILSVLYGDGIYYNVYLEYNNGGRFAIIAPTVDYWGPILVQDVAARVRDRK